MRRLIVPAAAIVFLAAGAAASADDVKQVPYPEVKVQVPEPYKPDAAVAKLQKALSDAVAGKNAQALFALVGPTFVWLEQDEIADQFDFRRRRAAKLQGAVRFPRSRQARRRRGEGRALLG